MVGGYRAGPEPVCHAQVGSSRTSATSTRWVPGRVPKQSSAGTPPTEVNQISTLRAFRPSVSMRTVAAVAVSSDGFLLAASAGLDGPGVEQFGAIISGLTSLSRGAANLYDYGEVNQVIIEMSDGYLFVMAVDDGSAVGVLAEADCDVGSVGYEMALLIERVGEMLTPALIDELKNALPLRGRNG